ncbi:ligand-binding sensor domain-containing diguanylate cyclase [Alteromonas sp. a30]|uniref:ligand-binding sensor domain-containing diguanylate cyclase n=1 Tax=Alteromonas sp. a30 TaxID=2730917 RepID=UPI00227F426E|nr:ligand-binding sensor domain-containing diguanylate cyclase [Alteromonas sp. a30]MCY7295009.1 diguanylate cyclase [Alteromonas sp. a30]
MPKLLILLLLFSLPAFSANEFRFDSFNVKDGLTHEVIRGVIQDKRGFLWIATEGGLNRYDGFNFVEFKYRANDKQSSNVISDLTIDTAGDLWLATLGSGVLKFDTRKHQFQRILPEQLSSQQVSEIFIDSNQQIWVGTLESGVNLIVKENGQFVNKVFPEQPEGVSHPSITAFAEDKLGRIWIGTDGGGVDIYQPETNSWQNLKQAPKSQEQAPLSLTGNRIRSLLRDRKGNIWIGTGSSGLNQYVFSTKTIRHYQHDPHNIRSLANNRVLAIYQDKDDAIWLGTDAGLSILEDDKFNNVSSNRANPDSLSNNRVMSIFQDRTGLMWIGTYSGLNKWNPATRFFNHNIPVTRPNLDHSVVLDITSDNQGKVYAATYGGGVAIKMPDGRWKSISTEAGLVSNSVVSILVDKHDGLWIGTRAQGLLYRASPQAPWTQFTHDPNDPRSIPSNGVTDIMQDRQGNIWLTTYSGGVSKKTASGFKNVVKGEGAAGLSSKNVFQVLEDKDGYIWLATDRGLNLLDPKDFSISQFLPDESTKEGLATELTWNLFEDSLGNMWIATQGHGVHLWLHENKAKRHLVLQHFTTENDLPSDTIYGFQEDNFGHIWMSTARGLVRLNPSDMTTTTFNVSHGLQGYDFNLGATHKDKAGRIYFGGNNGFNWLVSEPLVRNNVPPSVELVNITSVDDRVKMPKRGQTLELKHSDYLVAFDYVALDFAAPLKNQYQYQLSPFDENWLYVGNLRRATYTNLPSGEYTFKVRAANNDGVWSEPQINLKIRVLPPLWRTPIAYSVYALLVTVIVFWFLRNHLKTLAAEEHQRKRLQELVDERTRELAQQNKQLTQLNKELALSHTTDALTGAKSRHFLDLYLKDHLNRLQQDDATEKMLLLLIDLDNLKPFNDTLGHAAGDALIVHFAETLRSLIPTPFHIIRWGGDEFMVVGLVNHAEESVAFVDSVKQGLQTKVFHWFNQSFDLNCSMGFAHYPFEASHRNALTWDQASMLADKAMYAAKEQAGVSWCGVMKSKREINELYISELMRCQRITQVQDLVEILTST